MQLNQAEKEMLLTREKMRKEQDERNRTEQFIKIMFSDEEMQKEYIERYKRNCNPTVAKNINPADIIELAQRGKTGKSESLSSKIKSFAGKLKAWISREKDR